MKNRNSRLGWLLAVLLIFVLAQIGCATIICGSTKKVALTTIPDHLTIDVNGREYTTPAKVVIKTNSDLVVESKNPATSIRTKKIERQLNPWIFANLIMGGGAMVGGAIDWFTDAFWTFDDSYHLDFAKGKNSDTADKSGSINTVGMSGGSADTGTTGSLPPLGIDPDKIEKVKLAIMKFKTSNKAATEEDLGETLTEMMNTEFINSKLFEVVERNQIDNVIKEQKFSISGMTDSETAITLGKLLNVKYLVLGSVAKLGEVYELDARIIETSKGIGIAAKQSSCRGAEKLRSALSKLSSEMIQVYYSLQNKS